MKTWSHLDVSGGGAKCHFLALGQEPQVSLFSGAPEDDTDTGLAKQSNGISHKLQHIQFLVSFPWEKSLKTLDT